MKKIILAIAIVGTIGLTSCNKTCYTCEGANIQDLNHNYCDNIYQEDGLEAAEETCKVRGGTWTEMAK